jgi:pimeloyl-ACP methyl ester carboxylesterase
MTQAFCRTGKVELCYESFGDPADPLVLLIMGLGLDLLWWREDFCRELAGRGLRVVRFDNRDAGRSTPFRGPGVTAWQLLRRRPTPTYALGDMADDAAGLIAELDPRGAHVVGVSLGALIAQEVAIRHPGLTRSLTSIMGRPGDGRTGRVAKRMQLEFLRPAGDMVAVFRRIGSQGRTAEDDEDVRAVLAESASRQRGNGSGSGRQLAAILTERDRTADLARLDVPALVIHGERDRIILPSGGRATAEAIPGAELLLIPGMGHDLARYVWPEVLGGIAALASR